MPLADILSRVPQSKAEMEKLLPVNNLTMQPIQDHRLAQMYCDTVEDPTMRALTEVIVRGWTVNKKHWLTS